MSDNQPTNNPTVLRRIKIRRTTLNITASALSITATGLGALDQQPLALALHGAAMSLRLLNIALDARTAG